MHDAACVLPGLLIQVGGLCQRLVHHRRVFLRIGGDVLEFRGRRAGAAGRDIGDGELATDVGAYSLFG